MVWDQSTVEDGKLIAIKKEIIVFWDKIASLYDLFERIYNKKVYDRTGLEVAKYVEPNDMVLECACGTGAITTLVAPCCKSLVATDYSVGMLRQAQKKCKSFPNVVVKKVNIMDIHCKDNRFDKVIAGNVIHLLPEPERALHELVRVVKPGGKIIIPTYINIPTRSFLKKRDTKMSNTVW